MAEKLDIERRELANPFAGARREGVARPDPQRGMHAEADDGVRGQGVPAGVDRMDDFEAMRDPGDTPGEGAFVHIGRRRRGEAENDLRFNARFGQSGQGRL
jgi:hypothetical protein